MALDDLTSRRAEPPRRNHFPFFCSLSGRAPLGTEMRIIFSFDLCEKIHCVTKPPRRVRRNIVIPTSKVIRVSIMKVIDIPLGYSTSRNFLRISLVAAKLSSIAEHTVLKYSILLVEM